MKKEMIISILVGLIFGLIIVYGVYTAQNSLTQPEPTQAPLSAEPSPTSETNGESQLVIHSPEDEIITDQKDLTIAGSTQVGCQVVIFTNNQPEVASVDQTGHFSLETELELGSNIIQIHALDQDGETIVKERTVIYTTQPLIENDEDEATESATEDTTESQND